MRKTRRSNTRRRQTKRGGKFQMKVKNTSCNNTGKNRGANALKGAQPNSCNKAGFCWKQGRAGVKEPWCYKPFPDKFNVIIKK